MRHRLDLVMRDIEDGRAEILLDALQLEPQIARAAWRRARTAARPSGRRRAAHQRAADGDALHLAAGKLRRACSASLSSMRRSSRDLARPCALISCSGTRRAGERSGKARLSKTREMRIERILLEHEGDVARRRLASRSHRGRRSTTRPASGARGPRRAAESSSCRRRSDRAARRTRHRRCRATARRPPRCAPKRLVRPCAARLQPCARSVVQSRARARGPIALSKSDSRSGGRRARPARRRRPASSTAAAPCSCPCAVVDRHDLGGAEIFGAEDFASKRRAVDRSGYARAARRAPARLGQRPRAPPAPRSRAPSMATGSMPAWRAPSKRNEVHRRRADEVGDEHEAGRS